MTWTALQVPAIHSLGVPVFVRVEDIPPHHLFPAHRHRWHQFIYSMAGSLTVVVDKHRFVCGPEEAVWIPTGTVHEVASTHGAKFRSLYVRESTRIDMPASYAVLEVTSLLRELILEASRLQQAPGRPPYGARVMRLILDQLPRLTRMDTALPWPHSEMLRKMCEELYRRPADTDDIAAWGGRLGASSRTLSRRFQAELGTSFRDWKRRLRLVKALEFLGAGMNITATALELGYGSTSAFTYMFTKEMGCSPKAYLATRRARAA